VDEDTETLIDPYSKPSTENSTARRSSAALSEWSASGETTTAKVAIDPRAVLIVCREIDRTGFNGDDLTIHTYRIA